MYIFGGEGREGGKAATETCYQKQFARIVEDAFVEHAQEQTNQKGAQKINNKCAPRKGSINPFADGKSHNIAANTADAPTQPDE